MQVCFLNGFTDGSITTSITNQSSDFLSTSTDQKELACRKAAGTIPISVSDYVCHSFAYLYAFPYLLCSYKKKTSFLNPHYFMWPYPLLAVHKKCKREYMQQRISQMMLRSQKLHGHRT